MLRISRGSFLEMTGEIFPESIDVNDGKRLFCTSATHRDAFPLSSDRSLACRQRVAHFQDRNIKPKIYGVGMPVPTSAKYMIFGYGTNWPQDPASQTMG